VEYLWQGRAMTATVAEKETLGIPEGATPDAGSPPAPELRLAEGRLALTAWQSGTYEFKTASGKRASVVVGPLPQAIPLSGPWSLRFPAGWGAPEQIELTNLISWPNHPYDGVKHFSGTATYVKEFDLPDSALGDDRVWRLDLGDVQVIAEVELNGTDLGILWKPPFAADVTSALRPGRNRLEVRVTNLWPNRLIGDLRLAPQAERLLPPGRDKKLTVKSIIPAWVLKGELEPKSWGFTFAMDPHYRPDSPLLDSGLLGPVRLIPGERSSIQPGKTD